VLGPSGLRRTRGGAVKSKGAGTPRCNATLMKRNLASASKEVTTQGGVTRRPNPKGRGERSSRTQGRRHGGKHSGFRKSVLLRGRRRNEGLGHLDKPTTPCSQKERRRTARRKRLQFFRSSGMVTKNARRGIEEGSSRNAGALHSSPSASEGSGSPSQGGISGVSLAGSRRRTLSAESFWLAADALPLRRQTRRQRKRTTSPARGATIRCGRGYWRSMGVPVRRI
jgi:hypothetical protein